MGRERETGGGERQGWEKETEKLVCERQGDGGRVSPGLNTDITRYIVCLAVLANRACSIHTRLPITYYILQGSMTQRVLSLADKGMGDAQPGLQVKYVRTYGTYGLTL